MPSLWNKQKTRKDEAHMDQSDSSEKHQKRSGPIKRLFSFGSKEKKEKKSRDSSADLRRHKSMHEQSMYPHMAPKTQEQEEDNDLQKLEDVLEGRMVSNRRPLAYEIFGDTNAKSNKYREERPTFVSEPSLNQNFMNSHQQKSSSHYQYYDDGRNDVFNVEMRKKSPNIFAGLVSKGQRQSLQMGYPGQGRMQRNGFDATRPESMYGYVPRAVSLHDASAVLFGQDKEDTKYPYLPESLINRFARIPDSNNIPEEYDEGPYSFQMPHHSEKNQTNLTNGHHEIRGNNDVARRSRQIHQSKQSSSDNNFYFSSSNLSSPRERTRSEHMDNEDFHQPSYRRLTDDSTNPLHNGHNDGGHNDYSNNNHISSHHHNVTNKHSSNTNANTHMWVSQLHVTSNNGPAGAHSHHDFDYVDNDGDVSSLLDQFDQLSGIAHSKLRDTKEYEGAFSSVGEILY